VAATGPHVFRIPPHVKHRSLTCSGGTFTDGAE